LFVFVAELIVYLDLTRATSVCELLIELKRQEGYMLVVVTHSLDLAGRLSRRMTIDAGRLLPLEGDGQPFMANSIGPRIS
jgi:predicted ABC-type transport system involved in lysophospholipase L1 biosynthesis ATPase subunit